MKNHTKVNLKSFRKKENAKWWNTNAYSTSCTHNLIFWTSKGLSSLKPPTLTAVSHNFTLRHRLLHFIPAALFGGCPRMLTCIEYWGLHSNWSFTFISFCKTSQDFILWLCHRVRGLYDNISLTSFPSNPVPRGKLSQCWLLLAGADNSQPSSDHCFNSFSLLTPMKCFHRQVIFVEQGTPLVAVCLFNKLGTPLEEFSRWDFLCLGPCSYCSSETKEILLQRCWHP